MDIDLLKRGAQFMLDKALDSVRRAEVKNVEFEVEEGPVARTIVARAKHHRVDMIVIGSRGMGDIEGALRGGVSHRVGILAKCPVLVVK
jgi:nucleotide-binding universal stress UspA family protein